MSSLNSFHDNENLIVKAQAGDEIARAQVHEANIGLVYMVLEKFKNTSYEYEDLFQVGSIGLLKAIDKFDFSYGVRFSTYAVPMIIGEIKKFLRDDGIVKVQRGLKETYSKIRWAQDHLRGELGREPGVDEIACLLDMDKEDIVISIEACQFPLFVSPALFINRILFLLKINIRVKAFSIKTYRYVSYSPLLYSILLDYI
jgi:RNA polymerase sporulation-specific sigma factor